MLENEPAIRLAAFVGVLAVMLLWEQLAPRRAPAVGNATRRLEPQRTLWRAIEQPCRALARLAPTAQSGQSLAGRILQHAKRDAMLVHQTDVGERHRHAPGHLELGWRANAHAGAAIHKHEQAEVLLLKKDAHEETLHATVDVPVHETKIVAGRIGTEVGELHALTTATTSTFALARTARLATAEHIEPLDGCHHGGVEQLFHATAHGASSGSDDTRCATTSFARMPSASAS